MTYKVGWSERSVTQLRTRRRRLVRALPDVAETLRGALTSQGRRCGRQGCRCARGELHGPYDYLVVGRDGGRSRMLYVPAGMGGPAHRRVAATARIEAVLAEISAINVELLARRELD